MPKRALPENWIDWASEDYEDYTGELQDWVNRSDDPSEMSYDDEDFSDEDLYGFHEVTADELFGTADSTQAPSKLPATRSLTWHYDDSGYYAYILLNGDETQRQEAVQLLTAKGIVCAMFGRSYRPANDKTQYDWYIRVYKRRNDRSLGKPTAEEILEAMPLRPQSVGLSQAQKDYVRIMRQEVNRLEEDLRKTRAEREDANRSLFAAKAKLLRREDDYQQVLSKIHELEVRSRLERTHSQQERTQLENRLLELAKEIDNYREVARGVEERELEGSIELEELRKTISRRQTEYDDVESAWLQAETKLQEQESELVRLANERDIALAALDEARRDLDMREDEASFDISGPPSVAFPEDEMRRILAILLPNIHLVRGSLTFLLRETKNPLLALYELRRLSTAPESVKCERVKTAKEWLEMHFSTGESNEGRLYFTKPNDSREYYVLLSHKDVQKRDFRWLARWKGVH